MIYKTKYVLEVELLDKRVMIFELPDDDKERENELHGITNVLLNYSTENNTVINVSGLDNSKIELFASQLEDIRRRSGELCDSAGQSEKSGI